jgi:hypothetical protein
MIEPAGEHTNRQAQVVQVLDEAARVSIVNRFNAAAQAPDFPGMLIDHEHFKHEKDKETVSYGWLMRLQNRADGIYGQIKWTATGKRAVDGGDYRFFSTEYDPEVLQILNDAKPRRVRPLALSGLTLTNMPNNKGGKPITNRAKDFRGAGASADSEKNNEQRKTMKSVAAKLGLSADASEEAVLAELAKVMNRATEAEGKVGPLTNRVQELEQRMVVLVDEQIDADLAARGVTDEKILNRVKPVLKGLANREERAAWLNDMAIAQTKTATTQAKDAGNAAAVLNRAGAKTPETKTPGAAASVEAIRNRANELIKGGMPFESAWAQARNEANQ